MKKNRKIKINDIVRIKEEFKEEFKTKFRMADIPYHVTKITYNTHHDCYYLQFKEVKKDNIDGGLDEIFFELDVQEMRKDKIEKFEGKKVKNYGYKLLKNIRHPFLSVEAGYIIKKRSTSYNQVWDLAGTDLYESEILMKPDWFERIDLE